MATSTPRNSNSNYGVSDHFSMEELPHPARNLTASRVVIMVFNLTLSKHLAWIIVTDSGSAWLGIVCIVFVVSRQIGDQNRSF